MAMLHPSDQNFANTEPFSTSLISSVFLDRLGLVPTLITSPSSSQGSYHKVYFVSLPAGNDYWSGRDVVLRVARKAFKRIKTENEVASIELVRKAGIPVAEVAFFSCDVNERNNILGYEYICMERIPYPSLSETWSNLSSQSLSHVLDQLIDFFIAMFKIELPEGALLGSLAIRNGSQVLSAPVLEETMWQLPDIQRYFSSYPQETFSSLNPMSSYPNWPAYISAFLQTYHHVIVVHSSVTFLSHLLVPLQCLIEKLGAAGESEEHWIQRLKEEPGLRGHFWHRDLHFGNILADKDGTIKGVIDWEFAGIGPSFHKTSSIVRNCMSYVAAQSPSPTSSDILTTWPTEFTHRLAQRSPDVSAAWIYESDPDQILGKEGRALSDVREYLRSCIEVGVRGWGNIEAAQGVWREIVESRLVELGCYQVLC